MIKNNLRKVNVICKDFEFKNKKISNSFMGHPKKGFVYNAFIDTETKSLRVVLPAMMAGVSGILFDSPRGSNEEYSYDFSYYGGLDLIYVDLESYSLNSPKMLQEWEESVEEAPHSVEHGEDDLELVDGDVETITASSMVEDFDLFISYAENLISLIQPRSKEISQGLIYLLEDLEEVLLEGLTTPRTVDEAIEMIQEMLNDVKNGQKRVDFRYLQMLFVYLSFLKNKET